MTNESEQCWLALHAYCESLGFTRLTPVYRSDIAKIIFKVVSTAQNKSAVSVIPRNLSNSLVIQSIFSQSFAIKYQLHGVCVVSTCVRVNLGWFDRHHCCIRMLFILIYCLACKYSLQLHLSSNQQAYAHLANSICFHKKKILNILFA